MSLEESISLMIKGPIAGCEPAQQLKINDCAKQIKDLREKFEAEEEGVGLLGMALAMAEFDIYSAKL